MPVVTNLLFVEIMLKVSIHGPSFLKMSVVNLDANRLKANPPLSEDVSFDSFDGFKYKIKQPLLFDLAAHHIKEHWYVTLGMFLTSTIKYLNNYLKETENTDIARKVKAIVFTSIYNPKHKRLNSAEQ